MNRHKWGPEPNRRAVIAGALASASCSIPALGRTLVAHPLTETAQGVVRGLHENGVEVFKGLPYGAPTGGANRYRPPRPPECWVGIRDATAFGRSAPQPLHPAPDRAAFSAIEPIGEDCLTLNIYTPAASPRARRPVMVWLHGGGWRMGAGSAPGLRGHMLAKLGDVVLVTINHRIDALGFLRIGDGDERFADSGNLGVLDMIAALAWVRDNIAAFGGDAGNVTIFGQSGGGAKVAALLTATAAKGLFHKAIAQSCSGALRLTEEEEARSIAARFLRNIGMPRADGLVLQSISLERLITGASEGGFRPIVDGRTFTRHPFDPDASPVAANIPLLVGNVATETRIQLAAGSLENFRLDRAEVVRRVGRFLGTSGDQSARIFNNYAAEYPADTPGDLLAAISSDYIYVRNTGRIADLHAAQGAVYSYMFMRESPVREGLLRSPHESEVPFIFGTTDAAANMVGDGTDIGPLTRLMIATWSSFARSGNPANAALPSWPRHKAGSTSRMLLDVESRFGEIPGTAARASLDSLPWFEYSRPTNYTKR